MSLNPADNHLKHIVVTVGQGGAPCSVVQKAYRKKRLQQDKLVLSIKSTTTKLIMQMFCARQIKTELVSVCFMQQHVVPSGSFIDEINSK